MAGHILSVTVKMKAHVSGPLSAGNDEYKQRWGMREGWGGKRKSHGYGEEGEKGREACR